MIITKIFVTFFLLPQDFQHTCMPLLTGLFILHCMAYCENKKVPLSLNFKNNFYLYSILVKECTKISSKD